LHGLALGKTHVPVVPVPLRTHRAGARHAGPSAVSHAAPSAAGAWQVPIFVPAGKKQRPPPPQNVTSSSQGDPAGTICTGTHLLVARSHPTPAFLSHEGAVRRVGSHGAPTVVAAGTHVPRAVADDPTHESPDAHGALLSHGAPFCPSAVQVCVDEGQESPGAQFMSAHDEPTGGALPHVPHCASFGSAQKEWAHCEGK